MKSLRLRAMIGAALWSAAALTAVGWIIWGLFSASAERQFDAMLEAHLSELASSIAVTDRSKAALEARMADPRFHRPLSGLYWQSHGPEGGIHSSRSLWDAVLGLPIDEAPDGAPHRHDAIGPNGAKLRVLERTVTTPHDGAWRILVASDSANLDIEKQRFQKALLTSFVVLSALLAVAAAAQAALTLRPTTRLKNALADYRAGRSERIEGRFPSEIAPLAEDLNATLARNEALIARARRRASDLAHALKTPAAALRGALERLKTDGDDPNYALACEALDRIDAQTKRQLARARIALGGPGATVAVTQIVNRLRRAMQRIYADKGLTIHAAIPPNATFRGDAEDLEEMLGNVLDNACKWARQAIWIHAEQAGERLTLTVEDDGPGVTEEALEELALAGRRLDLSQDGAGLGLAIVSDIVEAYGGAIELSLGAVGGVRVALKFEKVNHPIIAKNNHKKNIL